MYTRSLQLPGRQSFFLFGPRGTGKTAWLKQVLADSCWFDLLDAAVYTRLLADPSRLGESVPAGYRGWVVVDEIQRVPELLNEIHRLIEDRRLRFAVTGSSARKLRRKGVNLLAGRALTRHLHPLTAQEIGREFDVKRALQRGLLPFAWTTDAPRDYLASYVTTYLREEVQQEGLARNVGAFGRFLEAASLSQGCVLNMAAVARDCAVNAKVVENYFDILEDLLLSVRIPVFARRAKRRLAAHPKFYFFDAGVFRAVRPRGPLDAAEDIDGPALETLVLQHLRATNDYGDLGYGIHYWRSALGQEVDFVLYGERGLIAIEVKRSSRARDEDLAALRLFCADYPEAKAFLVYTGTRREHRDGVDIVPIATALAEMPTLLQ